MKFFVKLVFIMLGIGVLFVILSIVFLPDLDVMGRLVTRNDEYGEVIVFSEETQFSNLTIDLKNRHVNVNFVDEDVFTMTYYAHENDVFEFGILDQTLVVEHHFESIWSNMFLFNFVSREYITVEINIPNDWDMTDLDIETDTGDIIIEPTTLKTFNDVSLNNATGRIRLSSISVANLSLDTSTGDVTLEDIEVSQLADIDLSTGDISLTNVNAQDLKIVCSTGKAILSQGLYETLDVRLSTGSIEISDVESKDYHLKTSTGDINVILDRYDELKFDLSTGTGKVSIDGVKQGTQYRSLDGTIDFVAQTSTGNINVEMDA